MRIWSEDSITAAILKFAENGVMPSIELLFEELTELKIMKNDKVDHPRKKSKDLADAVCGAVFGSIANTPKDIDIEVDVHTFADRPKPNKNKDLFVNNNVIRPEPPKEALEYLDQFKLI